MWAPITTTLLAVNVLFFVTTYFYEDAIYEFALIPVEVARDPSLFPGSSLSSIFLHGNVVI
ncbi:MAG: hypothetical protein V3T40_01645 [Nitrososphaerales archaeon]